MDRMLLRRLTTHWMLVAAGVISLGISGTGWCGDTQTLSLDECLTMALERNQLRPASRLAVATAEAQHRQVLSGYWPQVTLEAGYRRMDEPPNFLFPATAIRVPPQSFTTPGGVAAITIPANSFGPGFPPTDLSIPVSYPGQTIDTPNQVFPVPEQDITLMDDDSWLASVNVEWLLLDGGMRRGLRERAQAGVEVAREELRRTELEIVDSVTRLYWGAVMAGQLRRVGADTLIRMEATLSLTEALYTGGAGRVTKADYLDNKIMVETLRSAVALLEQNEQMAQAALAYTLGLSWRDTVRPADVEIPFDPLEVDPAELVGEAYEFSPDWRRLEAGIRAAEGGLREARSGYSPKVAVTGELHRWWNGYDAGMATDVNKRGWSVGIGLRVPLFNGFLTGARVDEARARLDTIRKQRILLREGIGLKVREVVLGLEAATKRYQATLAATTSATENRELNTRAYQNDLVDTEDVIQAQLMEALMSAQHFKVSYDHAELRSRLGLVIGKELSRRWGGGE